MTKTLATSAFLTAALLLGAASPALAKPDKATLELVMPVLVRGSKSGDFETRAAAVEALGYGPKKDVEKAITESLTDPQWNVRRGAIRALDHMKDKRAWEKAVGAAMRDPKVDADEVMRLIEPLGAKKGVALVMANLKDDKFPDRERYVLALERLGGDWLVEGFKAGLALKGDAKTPFESEVVKLPLKAAAPLHDKLFAKYPSGAQKAILDKIGPKDELGDIGWVKPLVKSKDADVAFEAAVILGLRGDASGKAIIVEAAKGEGEKKKQALKALVPIATPDIEGLAKDVAKDTSQPLENLIAAYGILHKLGNQKLASYLEKQLESTDVNVRAAAIYYIADVKGRAAVPDLVPLLGAGPLEIRMSAVHALGRLGVRDVIPELGKALDIAREKELKLAIIGALGAIRDADVVPIVRFHTNDPDTEIRKAAVQTLAAVHHASAAPDLEVMMNDRDREVRAIALKGLVALDPEAKLPQFKKALPWLEPDYVSDLVKELGDKAKPHLELALASSREDLRAVAFASVPKLSKTAQITVYDQLARTSAYPAQRAAAIDKLVALTGKDARPTLEALAKDKDENIRVMALAALGQLGVKETEETLRAGVDDPSEKIRVASAAALIQL
ncbi:MAG: HEAT repeat domain-containing protein [Deltaproteobacteria bacterium]|nr:HEAT repeat domain-containing protein [Deltaproteobacteria bacterium]